MKALSLKQPWANLVACGYKTLETRTWATGYRGELLICSSASGDIEPTGRALAVVNLVECREMEEDDAPAACYPPEADFLVRSTNRPQDVVNDWQMFKQLREAHPTSELTDRWGSGIAVGSYYQTRSQDVPDPVENAS